MGKVGENIAILSCRHFLLQVTEIGKLPVVEMRTGSAQEILPG